VPARSLPMLSPAVAAVDVAVVALPTSGSELRSSHC
jgi:hypothetical protein